MNNNNDIGKTNPNGGALFGAQYNAGFGPDTLKDIYKNAKEREAIATSREKKLEGVREIFKVHNERNQKMADTLERLNELEKKKNAEKKEKERLAKREEALEKIDKEYSTEREDALKRLSQGLKGWGQIL